MLERVLVVDDDKALRGLLALVGRRAGFEVDLAGDGVQALQAMAGTDYLVVILDLQMPNMNGFDVIQELRARERRPSIIVLTAMPTSSLIGLDGNVVQAVIRKPFDVNLLTGILTELAATARREWVAAPVSEADADEAIPPN